MVAKVASRPLSRVQSETTINRMKSKPLTKMQIEATMDRMKQKFGVPLRAILQAEDEAIRAAHLADQHAADEEYKQAVIVAKEKTLAAIGKLISPKATSKQREVIMDALDRYMYRSGITFPGIRLIEPKKRSVESPTNARKQAIGAKFEAAMEDLRYSLIMADNTSFQRYIDAFESKVGKLLK